MRLRVAGLAIALSLMVSAGERHKPYVDAESDDGILLQRIQQEPLAPRRLALLEKFATLYPKADAMPWIYEQLLPISVAAKDWDKVLLLGDKLLALDPLELDAAHDCLQAAEAKNDPDLIAKYAQITWDIASKDVKAPKPSDPEDLEDWKGAIEYARGLLMYSEYTLYAQHGLAKDPEKKKELLQALEARNPKSPYLDTAKRQAASQFTFVTMTLSMAEQGLHDQPDNEDMLLTVAQHNMQHESDLQRVLNYSLRIIEIMQTKAKPEANSAEEWDKKKFRYLGAAYWMAGVVYSKDGRYGPSERYLKNALPYVRGNPGLLAAAFFYIGYDNYALAGQLRDRSFAVEALKYTRMCLEMNSPFRELAQRNVDTIKNDFNIQ